MGRKNDRDKKERKVQKNASPFIGGRRALRERRKNIDNTVHSASRMLGLPNREKKVKLIVQTPLGRRH